LSIVVRGTRATVRHLPYGITSCYLPPDTSECSSQTDSQTDCPPIDSIITLMTVWMITWKIIRTTIMLITYARV